jgi:hypothetical protein
VTIRAAAFAAALTFVATPAFAQYGWRGDYGPGPYYRAAPYEDSSPYYGPRRYEAPRTYGRTPEDEDGLSRYEIMEILRAAHLQPVSRPWRAGAHVMIRATNARGEVVRVTIDAYRGRIVAVGPAATGPSAGLTPEPRGAYEQRAPYPEAGENPPVAPPRVITAPRGPGPEGRNATATTPRTPMPRPRPAETTASIKPAPEATPAPAPAAAVPPPAPAPETAPAEAPRKETPAPAGDTAFPPVAPLD